MVRGFVNITLVAVVLLASGSAAGAYTLKTLYNFCSQAACADGSAPAGALLRDGNGNFFGTTTLGGANGEGAVFELKRNGDSWTYQLLHSLCSACGESEFPTSKLVLDVAGNLYGTAPSNGERDCGFVFRLSPNGDGSRWKMKRLHFFCAFDGDGSHPKAGLTYAGARAGALYDGVSPLYGVTFAGGANGEGAAYEIRPNGAHWKERVIYSFCPGNSCGDGAAPDGDLLMDAGGNLYGNTFRGGASNDGAVYELTPRRNAWREQVLYSFCNTGACADGSFPQGGLAMDAAGHLFGTTSSDDREHGGTLYRLAPRQGGARETVLHSFCISDCSDGFAPDTGPLLSDDGSLFGTTEAGGEAGLGGAGTVYRLQGKTLTTLYGFCAAQNCTDGGSPQAPVLMDEAGNLFGVTFIGGAHSGGTIFELSP